MSDLLFSEIDEELRREKAQAFWKRYGLYIAGAAFLVLAVFGGWRAYQNIQLRQAASDGDRLFVLVQKSENELSANIVNDFDALARTSTKGVSNLARFQMAANTARLGNVTQGVQYYDLLSKDGSLRSSLQEIA